jgi:hypothetical protein
MASTMNYYTFEFALDCRHQEVWARYTTEQIQLGPYPNELAAWASLVRTIGAEQAETATLVAVNE